MGCCVILPPPHDTASGRLWFYRALRALQEALLREFQGEIRRLKAQLALRQQHQQQLQQQGGGAGSSSPSPAEAGESGGPASDKAASSRMPRRRRCRRRQFLLAEVERQLAQSASLEAGGAGHGAVGHRLEAGQVCAMRGSCCP